MKSIRTRVLVSGLTIIFILCIVLGTTASLFFYNSSIENAEDMVTSNAISYAHSISKELELLKIQIENIAKMPQMTDESLSISERKAILADAATETDYKDFSVSDSNGQTYSDTDISQRDYFQNAINGITYISSPVIRMTDGLTTVMGGAKIDNGTGYDGVVYGGIEYSIFSDIITNIKVGETGYGYIVDKNGSIIAHENEQIVIDFAEDAELAKQSEAGIAISSFVDNMVSGETGTEIYAYDGGRRCVAYVPIESEEGWSLAVVVDYDDLLSHFNQSLLFIIGISIAIMIIASIAYIMLATAISKPITSVTNRLHLLSEGDLTTETEVFKNKDETGQLSRALDTTITRLKTYIGDISNVLGNVSDNNLAVEIDESVEYLGDFLPIRDALSSILLSLNETMNNVNDAAIRVNEDARQVSSNSQNLSQTTTEQAATVEELSSTVQTISEQIRLTADNARSANALSIQTGNDVKAGNEQMEHLVASMSEIEQSSQEIAKIIKVIDDIAFQTNILALNAAVEAARAGAAGKGFAVVADEVRNLALKSAEAAKTTNNLIASSMDAVGRGTEVADSTAEALHQIVDKVNEVASLIDEISSAASDEATAVDSINTGMSQIASVTQNNSATAEEGAASSDELLNQSETLKSIVDGFKLK